MCPLYVLVCLMLCIGVTRVCAVVCVVLCYIDIMLHSRMFNIDVLCVMSVCCAIYVHALFCGVYVCVIRVYVPYYVYMFSVCVLQVFMFMLLLSCVIVYACL